MLNFLLLTHFVKQPLDEKKVKWYNQIKKVYSINFIHSPKKHFFIRVFCMTDEDGNEGVDEDTDEDTDEDGYEDTNYKFDGVTIILINLSYIRQIEINVEEGMTDHLKPIEWWAYLIEHSEELTPTKITNYRKQGMPLKILKGMNQLKLNDWPKTDVKKYKSETTKILYIYEKGKSEGKNENLIEICIQIFLAKQQPPSYLSSSFQLLSISKDFANNIWKTKNSSKDFKPKKGQTFSAFWKFFLDIQKKISEEEEESDKELSEE